MRMGFAPFFHFVTVSNILIVSERDTLYYMIGGWNHLFIDGFCVIYGKNADGWVIVHKEELIRLHKIMAEIKDSFEEENPENDFSEYYALKIDPTQVHKSKMEHKHAIFILGQEIAEIMKENEHSAPNRVAARMREMARRTEKEIDYLS